MSEIFCSYWPSIPLDSLLKGLPHDVGAIVLGDVPKQNWNVLRGDLPLPLAVLNRSALAHNSRWMREFLAPWGAVLCPHGKTTMSPQLHRWQIEEGAWGITLATISQVRVARRFGISRIVLANQLVGRADIEFVLDELSQDPNFEFYCLVDSVEGVRILADAARRRQAPRPAEVLIELGIPGARTGCRDDSAAMKVAAAIQESRPWVRLRGVEGFEGLIRAADANQPLSDARGFLQRVGDLAARLDAEGYLSYSPVLLSAGGSMYFDVVVDVFSSTALSKEKLIVVRSGCYLTHDEGIYRDAFARLRGRGLLPDRLTDGPRPALEVWSYVQSRPEAELAVLTMGKRDVSFDAGLPVPHAWYRPGEHGAPVGVSPGHEIVGLHDQHAVARIPADSPWRVGDMIASGVSHPCTTFDKWGFIPIVDEAYHVVDAITTCF